MSIRQISVFLENRPGQLKKMTGILAEAGTSMRALSLAETSDFGIARLITDDAYDTINLLKDADFIASLTEVLAVEIPDEAGGLDKILSYFAEANVNIEYMYAFLGGKQTGHAYMIFRVTEIKTAEMALIGKGLKILDQDDICQI